MNIEELEKTRIKYKKSILKCILICIILCGTPFLLVDIDTACILAFIGLIIGVIITIFLTGGPGRKYKKAYKEYFVETSLNKIFTDLKYNSDSGMPRNVISSTKMMYMGDRYSSNDFMSGKYKNVGFSQADVCIEEERERTDSEGHTRTYYVTIFRGRWMIFDFNKQFKANIQVAQRGFGDNKVQQKGLFSKKDDNSYYKKVEMESEEFNKRFTVYAQSEHEAFYILTPSLMEKIERLDDNNSGKLLLCFINNRLHIGLYDNKDSFEAPSCFSKINEEEEINKTNSDIKTITQFIDELNLDNRLFKNTIVSQEGKETTQTKENNDNSNIDDSDDSEE